MITLKAQNLTHLVDPSYVVVDEDLHQAQQKFLYKVLRDKMLHHEAKSIVKSHLKTKDTALIWQKMCETYDKSMSTSLNGDAILGWLTGTRLDDGKWNRSQGEYITFYEDKINKFNEMCTDSEINDMQGVRMLNLRPKIQGLMEFSDSDDEDEDALDQSTTMEEALAIDARGEIDDPDISEDQSIEQKSTAKMFKGMLQFSESEDEDEFQLQTHGFTSSIE